MKNGKKLRLTPFAGRLDKAESICAQMAEEGYALSKCGNFFMHFYKTNESYIYRAELSDRPVSSWSREGCTYDDEYDEKCWLCMPGDGYIRIYRAENGTEPPNIAPLRRTRVSRRHLRLQLFALLLFPALLLALLSPFLFNIRGGFFDRVCVSVANNSVIIVYILLVTALFVPNALSILRLYRANKAGKRIAEPGFAGVFPLAALVLWVLLYVFLTAFSFFPSSHALPESSSGEPYLLIADTGARIDEPSSNIYKTGWVKSGGLLFIKTYRVHQSEHENASPDGLNERAWLMLDQEIYELKNPLHAKRLVEALKTERKRYSVSDYPVERMDIDGFDEVWNRGDACIALKGTRVAVLRYSCFDCEDGDRPLDMELILKALAQKWKA